ncbi:MAG: histidine ammonia-lyase [Sphingobacterium sp.]
MEIFHYGEDHLTWSIALAITEKQVKGCLSTSSRQAILTSAEVVSAIAQSEQVVYGINTGFGPLCTTRINAADTQLLQENILKSHAVGVGKPIDVQVSKLMLVLKVHALAKGYSGVRLETVERLIWHIEEDIIPVVPMQGSVGASGDLAPLAHLFLPLIGLGEIWVRDQRVPTAELLASKGVFQLTLGPKEGLALINGTQFMAAHGVLACEELLRLMNHADLIGSLMIEGLNGSIKPFFAQLHHLRPYPGTRYVADTIFNLLEESSILESHRHCSRVQDPYSMRCIPQVHGATRNAWLHFKELLEIEINSVTDNPIVIDRELTISGGSFHGQPIALPMDYLAFAAAELGNISDRRIYLSLAGETQNVPKLLMRETGLNSGFMILQYTTAALASENKSLCYPASADSIPTSLGQEDHVSMGSISGRKLRQIIANVEIILSIEMICAAQAKDFHAPLRSTPIIEAVHERIRKQIPHIERDQPMTQLLADAQTMIRSGVLLATARQTADRLNLPYHGQGVELF